MGVDTGGFAEVDRESEDILAVGVGVPEIDGRDFSGGGPIEPPIAWPFALADAAKALNRVVLARTEDLTVAGVSEASF